MTAYILIIFCLASVVQFYSGAPFYRGAFKSVRNCSANMDVLVVLGTTAAWSYGVMLLFMRLCLTDDDFNMGGLTPDEKLEMIH